MLDPAMFAYFDSDTQPDDETKEPLGLAVTHVDDVLHAGSKVFDEQVIDPLKEKFGTEEVENFRYVGFNMKQDEHGIVVDHDHYVLAIEDVNMDVVKDNKADDVMN